MMLVIAQARNFLSYAQSNDCKTPDSRLLLHCGLACAQCHGGLIMTERGCATLSLYRACGFAKEEGRRAGPLKRCHCLAGSTPAGGRASAQAA